MEAKSLSISSAFPLFRCKKTITVCLRGLTPCCGASSECGWRSQCPDMEWSSEDSRQRTILLLEWWEGGKQPLSSKKPACYAGCWAWAHSLHEVYWQAVMNRIGSFLVFSSPLCILSQTTLNNLCRWFSVIKCLNRSPNQALNNVRHLKFSDMCFNVTQSKL